MIVLHNNFMNYNEKWKDMIKCEYNYSGTSL